MRIRSAILVPVFLSAVLSAALFIARTFAQEKGGEDETGPYDVVAGFPQPIAPKGYVWGSQAGCFCRDAQQGYLLRVAGNFFSRQLRLLWVQRLLRHDRQ